MNSNTRFTALLITATLVGPWLYAQAIAQTVNDDYPNGNRADENSLLVSAPTSTVYTWSTSTTGFAWLNATQSTGNPGHYPGLDANTKSTADGTITDIAAFAAWLSHRPL
jgi:hypothetical protein